VVHAASCLTWRDSESCTMGRRSFELAMRAREPYTEACLASPSPSTMVLAS
jgi:hypothetical protein